MLIVERESRGKDTAYKTVTLPLMLRGFLVSGIIFVLLAYCTPGKPVAAPACCTACLTPVPAPSRGSSASWVTTHSPGLYKGA